SLGKAEGGKIDTGNRKRETGNGKRETGNGKRETGLGSLLFRLSKQVNLTPFYLAAAALGDLVGGVPGGILSGVEGTQQREKQSSDEYLQAITGGHH
ncbi:hypothetical protein, partial [Dyella sp. C11]|uniref:hypothetical protein n=1 Tax=Dyella sp. C11 TaxID=2126991 RepID=UPI0018E55D24